MAAADDLLPEEDLHATGDHHFLVCCADMDAVDERDLPNEGRP